MTLFFWQTHDWLQRVNSIIQQWEIQTHAYLFNKCFLFLLQAYKGKQIKMKENIYRLEEKLQSVVTQIALENMKKLSIFTLNIFKISM